jgi:WD40 repeat protein
MTVRIWSLEPDESVKTLQGHRDRVYGVAVSPDGKYVVSGSWDKTIRVWDIRTGEYVKTLKGHVDFVNSVAIFPDSEHLVSGSEDKTVKIWDIGTGEVLKTLKLPDYMKSCVSSVAVSHDGEQITAGSVAVGIR